MDLYIKHIIEMITGMIRIPLLIDYHDGYRDNGRCSQNIS
jgi:hypothetical protein